ncbi:MAG TPA: tRNA pseudouridine(55) synthase TruB [Sediminibacterium sp.]|nr:tRNA pseudouridine(55) synthase TruB [Sediminibacterium sp.]
MKQKQLPAALQPFLEGKVLLIDKPLDWTSFDVIRKMRNLIRISKIGHAGTLDPLASGLLIVCTGRFTKQIQQYMGMEKEYTGSFTLGATTPTYDLESEPRDCKDTSHLTAQAIHDATRAFTGNILQVPPIHSAIKQDGKPVYLAARKGVEVQLEPRPISIHRFDIESIVGNQVGFRVVCSTGTYIRSLANDFGAALGVGAYLSSLRRTRIGNFKVEDAYTVEAFAATVQEMLQSSEG